MYLKDEIVKDPIKQEERKQYPKLKGQGRLFIEKKKTLSTAESCTGGYIAHLITQVPGASAYFMGSTVTYSNELKEKALQNTNLQRRWLAISLLLLTFLGGLAFYTFRQRQQNLIASKEREIEKQLSEITFLRKDIARILEETEEKVFATTLSFEEINHLLKEPLSEREFEILQYIREGKNNREIAETIHLSINTIKYHLKNIYTKLEVSNRLQAVQLLLKK